MPEKDEISLIVEGHYSPSSKLRLLREQRGEKPTHPDSHSRVEVVENQFWDMLSGNSMMFDLFLVLDVGDLEDSEKTFEVSNEHFPALTEPDHNDMCKIKVFRVLINLLKFHVSPWVEGHIVEHHHQFAQEVIDLPRRFQLSSHQDFDGSILFQDIVELVHESLFLVILLELLSTFLLILDRHRLLSFFSGQFFPLLPIFHLDLVLDGPTFVMHLYSFLFVFDLVGFLLVGCLELLHGLGVRLELWLLLGL